MRYETIPKLLEEVDKARMIELAREFVKTGVKGFAAVSSTDKAMITALDNSLNF